MLTVLISMSASATTVYDLNQNKIATPENLVEVPNSPYFTDSKGDFYVERPVQVNENTRIGYCFNFPDRSPEGIKKTLKDEKKCTLQMVGHNLEEAKRFHYFWNDEFYTKKSIKQGSTLQASSMDCYHNLQIKAPQSGNWSNNLYLLQPSPNFTTLNIKSIAAVDDNPFGHYPLLNEVKYTDLIKNGDESPYLPFVKSAYYSVGNPNGDSYFIVRSRLQKADPKQSRIVDIYYCY